MLYYIPNQGSRLIQNEQGSEERNKGGNEK